MEEIEWETSYTYIKGKQYSDPRKSKLFSNKAYTYAGMVHTPTQNWPLCLENLKIRFDNEFQTYTNSCLCTLYNNGSDSMGWHADDEEELGKNPTIFSVSLGESREFKMKRTIPSDESNQCNEIKINLTDGSLLIMLEATQMDWKHCIPKVSSPKGRRINLTFRQLYEKENCSPKTNLSKKRSKYNDIRPPPTESDTSMLRVKAWLNAHL